MQQELSNSIKARLYDFKYTPFMSSYLFAWIYFNAKVILIFFNGELSVNEKVNLLSYSDIIYLYPLYFALFYVFIFPIATLFFYSATLQYRVIMNKIQQKMQDKTPLLQETARAIRKENAKLQSELDEYIEKNAQIKADYKKTDKELQEQITLGIKKRTQKINKTLIEKNGDIESKKNTISELEVNNIKLQKNIKKLTSELRELNSSIITKK